MIKAGDAIAKIGKTYSFSMFSSVMARPNLVLL
jgi:hypothetical protein